MRLRTLKESPIKKGTRVLIRADFDVSLKNGGIEDDLRVLHVLPTLRYVLKKRGCIRILSHVGRPDGRKVSRLGMASIALRIEKLLKRKVVFLKDPLSGAVLNKYKDDPSIIFFENVRFWKGEEENDFIFAKKLSRWGDVFVNEAFAASHRPHASIVSLPRILPSFAGFNLELEIYYLSSLMKNPRRPFIAILGGAKLETKMPLVERFLKNADRVLMGGALANQALYLKGLETGKSPIGDMVDKRRILKALNSKKLYLPMDVVVSDSRTKTSHVMTKRIDGVGLNDYIVDLGPASVKMFVDLCRGAKTVVWNGPLGLIELKKFSKGTIGFTRGLSRIRALKVVGGGDTLAVLRKNRLLKGFTFVSTGGGAMLDFLAGEKLPGIEALKIQN